MCRKKINFLNILLIGFTSLQVCALDVIEGQSGEIISIPAPKKLSVDQLTFKTPSGAKQLVSLPFVKQDLLITRHHIDIKVNWVNFGESRITITDTSKVTLNDSDQARANREALEIKEALKSSTTCLLYTSDAADDS